MVRKLGLILLTNIFLARCTSVWFASSAIFVIGRFATARFAVNRGRARLSRASPCNCACSTVVEAIKRFCLHRFQNGAVCRHPGSSSVTKLNEADTDRTGSHARSRGDLVRFFAVDGSRRRHRCRRGGRLRRRRRRLGGRRRRLGRQEVARKAHGWTGSSRSAS